MSVKIIEEFGFEAGQPFVLIERSSRPFVLSSEELSGLTARLDGNRSVLSAEYKNAQGTTSSCEIGVWDRDPTTLSRWVDHINGGLKTPEPA